MAHIECLCPPRADGTARHPDGDEVTLRPVLSFHDAIAIRNDVGLVTLNDSDATPGEILATLTESYLLFGIERWTLVDEKGKPVPVSKAAIRERLLTNLEAAVVVGEEADGLYAEAVVLPLLLRASKSSPPSPTDGPTSATSGSRPRRPKPSSPSSTTTTPTGSIAATTRSPAGAFS
jgi:hypothetical protein